MNGTNKDIDPASELREEDEESSLPEMEFENAPIGTLAAGRTAIMRFAKVAPSAPGVYRMIGAQGDVLYVGKAKNIKKRVTAYARPTGHDSRIARMIAATVTLEFVTTKTETEALLLEANLIKRLRPRFNVLLRDDKSFPYILITSDHWAPQILKHRGASYAAGTLLRAVRLGGCGQSHNQCAGARLLVALVLGFIFRGTDATVPALSDQALLGALHARDRFRRLHRACARSQWISLRPKPVGAEAIGERNGQGVGCARF